MSWQSGQFERHRIPGAYRKFAPTRAEENLESVSLPELWEGGKRLILLDVDNTLVRWKTEEFAPDVLEWLAEAKALGFDLCIISNTRRIVRLQRLSERLEIPTVRGRFKPSRAMYRLALIKFGRHAEEAVMIGDQMMTDIFGANRAGIDAIWVRKMEGKEFVGTRVNRTIEKWLTGRIYRALVLPEVEDSESDAMPMERKPLVQQLLRFAIVGGTSFVIDYCIRATLMFATPFGTVVGEALKQWVQPEKDVRLASLPAAALIAWVFATFNSFVWNRKWTFEAVGQDEKRRQMIKFFTVAAIGGLINIIVSTVFAHLLPGEAKSAMRIATLIGTGTGAVWNFVGQKLFAFRRRGA
ncbi:YqeG family HAD IIIA-type phosphatase [bacterium]|nr:MAG: YqeG family HAD IIIA-type phosphatase [bacterium]